MKRQQKEEKNARQEMMRCTKQMIKKIYPLREKYSLEKMLQNLIKQDGVVLVDRGKLCKSPDDIFDFGDAIYPIYAIKFKGLENCTVFFEIIGNAIYAGAYDMIAKKKVFRRNLISTSGESWYTYTDEDMRECKAVIESANAL